MLTTSALEHSWRVGTDILAKVIGNLLFNALRLERWRRSAGKTQINIHLQGTLLVV